MMDRVRAPSGLRELPAEVRALVAVAFMVALGYGVVAPAIPLFAREFGVSKTAASAVISAFALMRLVTAPFAGRLVNAVGERWMLGAGIFVVAASSLVAGFAQDYWQLLVLRGVGGAGSVMFSVSAASILIRVTPSHLRGRAQGAWAGAFLVGLIAGPAVGTVATWSLRAPFFLYAVTLVVAGGLAFWTLRRRAADELGEPGASAPAGGALSRSGREAPIRLGTALRNRAYLGALAATFAGAWAVVGTRTAIVPQFVTDRLGLDTHWVYIAFVVVSLVSGAVLLPFGRLADTRGRRPVIVVGLMTGVVAFVLLPAAQNVAGLLVAMVLLGVAGAADSVAPGAVLGDVVGRRGGTVVAFYQMSRDLGTVLGPVVAGWLADRYGYEVTMLVSAGIVLAALPGVVRAPETLVREPAEPEPAPLR
jgi:MFS family permease